MKQKDKEKYCGVNGKEQLTKKDAEHIIKYSNVPLDYYKCPFCNTYHLTSKKRK